MLFAHLLVSCYVISVNLTEPWHSTANKTQLNDKVLINWIKWLEMDFVYFFCRYVLKKMECKDEAEANKAFKEAMALQELAHPYICGYRYR